MPTVYSSLVDHDLNTLRDWLVNISLAFHEKIVSARNTSTCSLVIERAKDYVRNNYRDENLSLDSICKVLGVSNSYFSSGVQKGNRRFLYRICDRVSYGKGGASADRDE